MTGSHPLERFVQAQKPVYAEVLRELADGRKRSHWMWFIFPQIQGLGRSRTAAHFAIHDLAEARAYLAHPVLGARLRECCRLLLGLHGLGAQDGFGSPDLKLRSCLTLFQRAAPGDEVFTRLLDKFFQGRPDAATLDILGVCTESDPGKHEAEAGVSWQSNSGKS